LEDSSLIIVKVAVKSIRVLSATDEKILKEIGKVRAGIDIQFHLLMHLLSREFVARPMFGYCWNTTTFSLSRA
jgi:hypothetical protein